MSKTDTQLTLKKRKENPDDGELDITPMIDITFLLLAFFVVVSKMDPQQAVDLPSATVGEAVQDKDSVILIIGKSKGWDGEPSLSWANQRPFDRNPF